MKVSGMVENVEFEFNLMNEDELIVVFCYISDGQYVVFRVKQFFLWLVLILVGLGFFVNQQKEKLRKFIEDRDKVRNVVKYCNEKYFKFWKYFKE